MGQYVEVEYEDFTKETTKAGLFVIDGESVWIPFSQIEEPLKLVIGSHGTMGVTRWIAENKNLEFVDD